MKKLILLAMLMVSPFLAFAQSGVSESGGSSNDLQFCIGLLGSTSTLLKQQGGNDPSVKNVIDTMEALLKVFKKIYISISGDIFTNEMERGLISLSNIWRVTHYKKFLIPEVLVAKK